MTAVSKEAFPTILDIMKSPEWTGDQALDKKALLVHEIISSGKHGSVKLCDSLDDSPFSKVAVKSELIKSPQNPHSRPYREYFILKQLAALRDNPNVYPNPEWVGFVAIYDWFKVKSDHVRLLTSSPVAFKLEENQSAPKLQTTSRQAPKTAPKPAKAISRLNFTANAENTGGNALDLHGLEQGLKSLEMIPGRKKLPRAAATPSPKRTIARTAMLMSSPKPITVEIQLQEGNLVLERMDTTLHHIRNNLSYFEFRSIIFQIFFALHAAQTHYEFIHHDLHAQNVLLKRLVVKPHQDWNSKVGSFKIGDTTWYLNGPWIAKLSDFGLSRITLVDSNNEVIHDIEHPISSAFIPDEDVNKILDDFGRSKLQRWLCKEDLLRVGANMTAIKDSKFALGDESISLDCVSETAQPPQVLESLKILEEERQKEVRTFKSFARKHALRLSTILHSSFFEPLQMKPTYINAYPSSPHMTSPSKGLSTPLALLDASGETSDIDSPGDIGAIVKKLSFSDTIPTPTDYPTSTNVCEDPVSCKTRPKPQDHNPANSNSKVIASNSPPFNHISSIPPKSKNKVLPIQNNTISAPARRSARLEGLGKNVASSSGLVTTPTRPQPKARLLRKPNLHMPSSSKPDIPEKSSDKPIHSDPPNFTKPSLIHNEQFNLNFPISKHSTASSRLEARSTMGPYELASSINVSVTELDTIGDTLASLVIQPDVLANTTILWKKEFEDQTTSAASMDQSTLFAPTPERFFDPKMVLPMLDATPISYLDVYVEARERAMRKSLECLAQRKGKKYHFFIRNAEQDAIARQLRRTSREQKKSKTSRRKSMGGALKLTPKSQLRKERRRSCGSPANAPGPIASTNMIKEDKIDIISHELKQYAEVFSENLAKEWRKITEPPSSRRSSRRTSIDPSVSLVDPIIRTPDDSSKKNSLSTQIFAKSPTSSPKQIAKKNSSRPPTPTKSTQQLPSSSVSNTSTNVGLSKVKSLTKKCSVPAPSPPKVLRPIRS